MIMCRECNEPIVTSSPIPDVCMCCYGVLDLDRFTEYLPPKMEGPFKCERCRDTGITLSERTEGNPSFLVVVPCKCKGGE